MAVKIIKGYDVAFYKDDILVGCADEVSLSVKVAEDETSCRATGGESEYEPGKTDITGQVSGIIRQATSPDAATNITAENIMDATLAKEVFEFRYSLGAGTGSARYSGNAFFTGADVSGSQEGNGKFSASIRVTGGLTKSLQPA